MITVLLAHAPGEEARAEELAVPLRTAGYDVWHFGDVVVGESLTEEASRVLSQNGPVVLCGTARAMGTRLPRHLLNAARSRGPQARIFPVHMDQDADLDSAVFGTQVAVYWADQVKAIDDLLAALRKYYPLSSDGGTAGAGAEPVGRGGLPLAVRSAYLSQLVQRYRRLDLEVLTPVEHETHLPVLLQSVFVPQGVRADPPPVELSKELWRRLVEAGEIDESDLPDGLDLDRLVHARDTYAQRPVQPVLDVVTAAEHRLLVLLGDPGAGKSTLARFLVLSLAGGAGEHRLSGLEGRLPILVELRLFVDLRRECPTFLDYLHRLHETDGLGLPADRLDDHLRRDGHALVVFDGLDELFDPKEREAVARQIVGFAARYPLVRIVVTSRVIGYRRSVLDDAGFTHYTIQDLDDEQVGRFADSWYQLALHDRPGEIAPRRDRLLRAIHGSASIRELAGNPLLLTILAIIGRRQELPRDRHEVYAHAAAVLVEQWDINRHLRDVNVVIDYIDSEDRRELLRRVAARMQNGRKGLAGNHIRGADLVNEFASYLRSQYQLEVPAARQAARVMLAQFWERNFILSRYGADVYGFVHHAFLEYFSAQEIVQRFHAREIDPDYLRSRVFGEHWADEAWQEVLLLVAGILGDRFSRQIVDYLAKEANPFGMETAVFSPRNLVLAVRCFVEVRNLAAAELQGRKILESLIETLEYSAGRSASEVDRMIEEEILPLIQVVGSRWPGRARYRDWFVVLGGSIAWWPTSKLIGGIFVSLFTDEPDTRRRFFAATSSVLDYRLRRAAVEVVASNWREDPETPGWLRARAVEDPDGFVRQAAVEAVASGWREDPETPGWLRVRAVQDEHRFVRQAAVRAVAVRAVASGSQGDPETLGWLRVRAVEDPHGFVRQAAVEAVASGWREDPETLGWVR
ncbi:NACHT domain-containing NTPase, partial [Frankia sp. R82]|uniref:NACHT domain-containing protein n=1 Tax=Frankia sp. R82 TaxID=2950553 RepID=UPI002042DA79